MIEIYRDEMVLDEIVKIYGVVLSTAMGHSEGRVFADILNACKLVEAEKKLYNKGLYLAVQISTVFLVLELIYGT